MSMRTQVRDYLARHYVVSATDVDLAIKTEFARQQIMDAEKYGSPAYYPADKIADYEGWEELEDLEDELEE